MYHSVDFSLIFDIKPIITQKLVWWPIIFLQFLNDIYFSSNSGKFHKYLMSFSMKNKSLCTILLIFP